MSCWGVMEFIKYYKKIEEYIDLSGFVNFLIDVSWTLIQMSRIGVFILFIVLL